MSEERERLLSGPQMVELGKEVLYSLRGAHGTLAELLSKGRPRDAAERERVFSEMEALTAAMADVFDVVVEGKDRDEEGRKAGGGEAV